MPHKPRMLTSAQQRWLPTFNELAKREGLRPIQLMDLHTMIRAHWLRIGADVLAGFNDRGENPLDMYDGDADRFVVGSVFACGCDVTIRPDDWSPDEWQDRMAFFCELGPSQWKRRIKLACDTIKATGWSLF